VSTARRGLSLLLCVHLRAEHRQKEPRVKWGSADLVATTLFAFFFAALQRVLAGLEGGRTSAGECTSDMYIFWLFFTSRA